MLYLLRSKLKKSQMSMFGGHEPPHHKAYTRTNSRGTVSNIAAKGSPRSTNAKNQISLLDWQEPTPQHEPVQQREQLAHGMSVMYRAPGMPKRRKGVITGGDETAGWQVTGQRQGYELTPEKRTLLREHIWTESEHTAEKAKSGKFEATSAHGRQLTAQTVNERAATGTDRLGISETEVIANPAIAQPALRIVTRLARQNQLTTGYSTVNGMVTSEDPEAMDLYSEYITATVNSLRRQTASAPAEMVDEFRDHLQGKRDNSRIAAMVARDGKSAAIRHIKAYTEHNRTHDSFDTSAEDDYESGMRDISEQSAVPHYSESEQKERVDRDNAIERVLSEIKPAAADLIKRRFGLGNYLEPQSTTVIAKELGTTKETIDRAVQIALADFARTKGSNLLRQFLKSLQELDDLRKALHIPSQFEAYRPPPSRQPMVPDVIVPLMAETQTGEQVEVRMPARVAISKLLETIRSLTSIREAINAGA